MTNPRDGDMIRFLHSADWQLGMTRRFLGAESQSVFTADRLGSVASLGERAVDLGAQFMVVAGDVFDSSMPSAEGLSRLPPDLRCRRKTPRFFGSIFKTCLATKSGSFFGFVAPPNPLSRRLK